MHDFVAIGDIVTDAFIRLKDAKVDCDLNRERCTISLAFGDKVPYEFVEEVRAVGNCANAAVAAARLGLSSALVSDVGDDFHGRGCLESLRQDGVSDSFMTIHPGQKTNYHYVLWYEDDRTILVKHEEYKRKFPDIGQPKWIYLTSLGEDTLEYQKEIAGYLRQNKEVSLAFQPGTFQMRLGKEALKDIYAESEIFFSNVDEAERILGIKTLGIKELLKRIHDLGPKMVVITDGPEGAYAYDGENMWHQLPYPDPKAPYERTGAGDAFSSTTVAALALGEDLPTALSWGAVNSMSVVQDIGAQRGLLGMNKIKEYLQSAPAEFKIKPF